MGHPGTLPTINKEAVKSVLKVGCAVGGKIADFTEFDRKNYFYPDIPKGYQISQYKYPLVSGGELAGVKITRIHLEEDTASSGHDEGDYSLVDFNRAGVPLMELVTEPVISSPEQAGNFGRELQLLLRYLGVSEANMEKGEMRVEVNVSVSDTDKFGTKVEVKNLNSFKAAERAIAYEVLRHIGLIERGEKIIQETRGWDDGGQKTYSQRKKEDSHDYRYFPDPDLPKLKLSEIPEFSEDSLKKEIPELPEAKRVRFATEYGIKKEDIELFVTEPVASEFFERVALDLNKKKELVVLASNYITSDLIGLIKKKLGEGKITEGFSSLPFVPSVFAALISMVSRGDISSRGAKDILAIMFVSGGNPEKIADEKGLKQKSDPEALKKIAQEIISANPSVVAEYKGGKEALLQFFIGQGMKASKGSANPEILKTIFKELL
jgi:aspartyl-tRNA(Asn)/glutamyl-tRNA(Gln) amidotransferase subunit B